MFDNILLVLLNLLFQNMQFFCNLNLLKILLFLEQFPLSVQEPTIYISGVYAKGRYAWILKNIEILERPINAKGHLGIWNYE